MQMSELSLALDELRECGQKLVNIATTLKGYYSGDKESTSEIKQQDTPPDHAPWDEASKKEKKVISFEEVKKLLSEKSRDGHTKEIKDYFKNAFGVEALSEILPDKYAELYVWAEALK
ncbi:hypothetical protein FACS1894105_04180 [Clostridia bacterium]|nr:hypothetical protein FACS1894105_04180 [Clostridia bacterium]